MGTRRRGHGEGSITERPDGRWHVRVNLGRLDGKRRRKHAYAATEAEATILLRRLGGRAVEGQLLTTSTPTVAAYLEEWFTTHSDEWRPSTQRSYRGAIDGHLKAFGPLRLEQLTPSLIQRWLTDHKKAHGARRRIALAHAILRSALTSAKKLQLVSMNAAELVTVPKHKPRAITPLTVAQARVLLTIAKTHRLGALFSVALACGLRLGEATGLRWDDVDLETGDVRIHQQLQWVKDPTAIATARRRPVLLPVKTEKSQRTLTLPRLCIEELRQHRTKQRKERLKAGPRWVDTGLVFTTYRTYREGKGLHLKVGAPLHPRNTTRILDELLTAAKLPHVRFHDLRHSAASLLIAAGVQLAEVSLLLGHSELRVTADLYAHLQQQTAAKAAGHMDAVLG